jgi:hypothetical protein
MKKNYSKGYTPYTKPTDGKKLTTGGWSPAYQKAYSEANKRLVQKNVNALVEKRKNLKKGSAEWNENQNKINSLLKDPTRHRGHEKK